MFITFNSTKIFATLLTVVLLYSYSLLWGSLIGTLHTFAFFRTVLQTYGSPNTTINAAQEGMEGGQKLKMQDPKEPVIPLLWTKADVFIPIKTGTAKSTT